MAAPAEQPKRTRIESDSMGQVEVPATYIGARRPALDSALQHRARHHAAGADSRVRDSQKACALVNQNLGKLPPEKTNLIVQAADEVIVGKLNDQFPCVSGRRAVAPRPT